VKDMAEQGIMKLVSAAIILVVFVVSVGIGGQILDELQENEEAYNVLSVENETLTNSSEITLANNYVISSSMVLWNGTYTGAASSPTTLNLNCTGASVCTISVNNHTGTGIEEAGNFTLTYNYRGYYQTTAFNTTGDGLGAMDDFSDWFTTIVVIIIASFIIVLLVRQFGSVGKSI